MSGFPPIDHEFYSKNPLTSIVRLGHLSGTINKESFSNLVPEWTRPEDGGEILAALSDPQTLIFKRLHELPMSFENLSLSFPTRCFDSLRALQRFLHATERPSHWYRGQNQQHQVHYAGGIRQFEEIDPRLTSIHITFDGLVPTFFRPVTRYSPARWDESGVRDKPPLDHFSAIVRAIMAPGSSAARSAIQEIFKTYLIESCMPTLLREMTKYNQWRYAHADTDSAKLPGTNVFKSQLQMIALAQHYEYGSIMVDVTQSIDVAVWLASHRWCNGAVFGPDGEGVIYWFDSDVISSMVQGLLHKKQPPLLQHLGLFGLVDISHTSADIARRPGVQMGGSLLGLENSLTFLLLLQNGGMEVFTFPHAFVDGSETGLSKDVLCPQDDPALEVFASPRSEDGSEPITPDELGSFLAACGALDDMQRQLVHLRSLGVL